MSELTRYIPRNTFSPQRVTTLARRGAGALGTISPGGAAALRAANFAVQYGPRLARYGQEGIRASKYIQRFIRARRARMSRRSQQARAMDIGEDPGTGTSKRLETDSDGYLSFNTNQLYEINLIPIQRQNSTNTNSLNRRERDLIHLVGIKCCMTFFNSFSGPLYHNVAVVVGKHRSAIDGTDFFRSNEADERSQDFTDTDLTSMKRHCLPINSDDFTVLKHKRWVSRPEPTWTGQPQPKSMSGHRTIEMYIPINRQIRFENDGTSSETPISLCHWHGGLGVNKVNSQTPAAAGSVEFTMTAYFKEPMEVYRMRYNYGKKRRRT